MSRRRVSIDDGSLELLLDTICNTFGGIIFISFLVVLLLNNSSDGAPQAPADPTERSKLIELDNERAQLTRRLERARRTVAAGAGIQSAVVSEAVVESAARFRRAQEQEARLAEDKSRAVGRANEAQEKVNEVRSQETAREAEVQRAEERLASIEEKLEAEIASKTEDAKVPRISATALRPVEFFLKEGRLYGPLTLADGTFNEREFVRREKESIVVVLPNPSGGVDVKAGSPAAGISERFARVEPQREYVRIWIWNDSFAGFTDVLRPVIDRGGLKLQLIPLTERDSIRLGPTGPPQEAQ